MEFELSYYLSIFGHVISVSLNFFIYKNIDKLSPSGFISRINKVLSKGAAAAAKLLQSCPTLCDPRDGSPPGFPIPGILQARTLEWVAISFSNA